jgi:hypothetical protein
MFDTCHKHMKCIQNFVDNSIATEIVVKYDFLIVSSFIIGVQSFEPY